MFHHCQICFGEEPFEVIVEDPPRTADDGFQIQHKIEIDGPSWKFTLIIGELKLELGALSEEEGDAWVTALNESMVRCIRPCLQSMSP